MPPIKAFDKSGRVIGLGTVSKILAPGLRIGWVNADPAIVRRMAAHKSDGGSCPMLQRIVVELLRNGKVDRHVATLTSLLRVHRNAMIELFAITYPTSQFRCQTAAIFFGSGCRLGSMRTSSSAALGRRACPSSRAGCALPKNRPDPFLRLAYSFSAPADIAEGIKRLGRAYATMRPEIDSPERGIV